jgi:aminoglycoside phosphotransferase (APT) family kinase protein
VSEAPLALPSVEIDLDAVSRWLASQGKPSEITDVEPLAGGSQNIVIKLTLDGRRAVLRHPPAHPRPHSNRAIMREMDLLSALSGTDVPHPRFIAGCRDESVLRGSVFYLMEAIDGFNPGVELAEAYRDPAVVRAAGQDLARVLAVLGDLDPAAIGLDIGRDPDNYLRRQIVNGRDTWRRYGEVGGYDPEWLPGVERVAQWLLDHYVTPERPGIVHGDYTLSNLLFRRDRGEVEAVLDWEMTTLGDPIIDLAWLLLAWPGGHEGPVLDAGKFFVGLPGMLTRRELLAAYAATSSRSVAQLDWYIVAAAFKFAIMTEGTYMRALEGKASKELGEYVHDLGRRLMTVAGQTIDGTWNVLDV